MYKLILDFAGFKVERELVGTIFMIQLWAEIFQLRILQPFFERQFLLS